MDVPKKYWWIVGIVVPIIVALITIIPNLLREKGTIYVAGNQFTGNVAFYNITIVNEQARQMLGKELPDNVLETLREALNLVQSREFDKAIPLLQSTVTAAPVPSVFNNLGAAYLATGNKEKAKGYFEKAISDKPDEETAKFNLRQLVADSTVPSGEKYTEEPLTATTTVASKEEVIEEAEKTANFNIKQISSNSEISNVDEIPIWVPLIPGYKKIENLAYRTGEEIVITGSFSFHTQDGRRAVIDFYVTKLAAMGWQTEYSGGNYTYVIAKLESKKRFITVNTQKADNQTKVFVTFEEKK